MSASIIRETPAARLKISEAEFERRFLGTKERVEWVKGDVIEMSPVNTQHNQLSIFLTVVLRGFIGKEQLGHLLGPELQIRLAGQQTRRVPDLLFVAQERANILKETFVDGPPDLIVEIVSPDSLAQDWREKYLEYEAAGVREYWVIDPMAKHAELYSLNDGKYSLISPQDDTIHSTVLSGFYLKPAWLWQNPLPNPLDILKELKVISS